MLADPKSPHTIKWAKALAKNKIDIFIFGLDDFIKEDYDGYFNITIKTLSMSVNGLSNKLLKLKYLTALPVVKKIIQDFKPDIVHAHYATSYGLIGALSGFHPFILSVWGNDIFNFPKNSFLHKTVLKYNLKKADKILSTSHVMAKEASLYTDKNIEVTPFGIDIKQFKPIVVENLFDANAIVIGTIKTLDQEYGIEYLIRSFKILKTKHAFLPLKLLIVGSGSLENKLKALVRELEIEMETIFTGKIPYAEIPKYHNMLSVSVSVSNSESFGVAIIEASSCGKPVVVSNVGGLPEVVEDGVTGIIVPPRNPEKTAEAIEKLILNIEMQKKMGEMGRVRVKKMFNWDDNVKQMIDIYKKANLEYTRIY